MSRQTLPVLAPSFHTQTIRLGHKRWSPCFLAYMLRTFPMERGGRWRDYQLRPITERMWMRLGTMPRLRMAASAQRPLMRCHWTGFSDLGLGLTFAIWSLAML